MSIKNSSKRLIFSLLPKKLDLFDFLDILIIIRCIMLLNKSSELLKQFLDISESIDEGLTHFIQPNKIKNSTIAGKGRFILNNIYKNELVAIVGGVLVSTFSDPQVILPIGSDIYLNQISMKHRVTANHSCSANLTLKGFNRLVAKRKIKANEELTLDYGTIFIGKGKTIIEECSCGSSHCRKTIRTNDYLQLPKNCLGAYAHWSLKHSKEVSEVFNHERHS